MRHGWMRRGVLIWTGAVVLAVPPVFGQTAGAPPSRTNRGRPMPSEHRRQRQQQYVQGEVVLENGTPAPAHVLIERFCGAGNGIPETHTDSRGRFSFELGKLTGFNPDATQGFATGTPGRAGEELTALSALDRDSGGSGARHLAGCGLRAVLPGFRSTTVELSSRSRFDDPDVGTIVLTPLAGVEGLGLSLVSLRAPEEARKSVEKGARDLEKRKWGNARKHFEKAVQVFPEHAEAWFGMGSAFEKDGKPDHARRAFEEAVAVDPRFVPPRLGLARLDAGEARWEALIERTDRILVMNASDFPEAWFYSSVGNFNRERYPQAERSAREAIARGAETRFPQVVHLLAMSLGYQGRAEEAIAELKRYLEIAQDGKTAPAAREQLAGLEAYVAKQRASAGKPASPPQP